MLTPMTDDFNRTRNPYEDDFRLYLTAKLHDSARIGWLQRQADAKSFGLRYSPRISFWFPPGFVRPRDGLVQMLDRWLKRVRDRIAEGRRIAEEALQWIETIWNTDHPGLIS